MPAPRVIMERASGSVRGDLLIGRFLQLATQHGQLLHLLADGRELAGQERDADLGRSARLAIGTNELDQM
jgi:hypothetical protein